MANRITPAGRVKVCGVTRTEDAVSCMELGVDWLGLNFWPGSVRAVPVERARAIADAVRGRIGLVGVFVDHSRDEVESIARDVGLDWLQFHGDEPDDYVRAFGDRALKAVRLTAELSGEHASSGQIDWDARFPEAWGFLFESATAGGYGGLGKSWDYGALAGRRPARPTLIAGGITPATAAAALESSGADGVDVASGVESEPGIKDPAAVAELVAAVRAVAGPGTSHRRAAR